MSSSSSRSGSARPAVAEGGVRDRIGGLFAKAANRASEGAGRLREVAGTSLRGSIVQHAHAARERGNVEAAFWLLDEAFREEPEDRGIMLAFWELAMELERGPAASAAGVAIVESSAGAGEPDVAARYFEELMDHVPEARVSPAAVARMLPPLCARMAVAADAEAAAARGLARRALAHALLPAVDGKPALTPGLAFHLFKEAREIDPESARRTAEIALASSELHEVKRQELERFLAEVGPDAAAREELPDPVHPTPGYGAAPTAPCELEEQPELKVDDPDTFEIASEPAPEGEVETVSQATGPDSEDAEPVLPPLSPDEVVDAARRLVDRHGPLSTETVPTPDHDGIHVLRAVPVDFEENALVLQLPGGRASRIGWKEIQALSVARVSPDGETPVIVIDCILNWRRRKQERMRLVRFYAADFVPADFVDAAEPSLSAFLTDLFERCQAAPLPDPESALGVRFAVFDDLESYQREVLEA